MRYRRNRLLAIASAAAGLILAACANRPPMDVTQAYEMPVNGKFAVPLGQTCRLFLGEITDKRGDTQAMGDIGGRPVHNTDSVGWVRSGLHYLASDRNVVQTATAAEADLSLSAEILKAYTMSLTTEKATTVVLRITFTRPGGAQETQVYRGADTSANWAGGTGETQSALNAALWQVVNQVHSDLVQRCTPQTATGH